MIAVAGANYLGTWDAAANTPALVAATHAGTEGDFYYISADGTTALDGVTSWRRGDKVIWNGSAWQKLQATSVIDGSTFTTLLNTQTSVFADGEGAAADPDGAPGWYYSNTENNKINWYVYGDTPSIRNELGDLNGFYAVVTPKNTTSEPYFSVYTKVQGDGNDQSWYRSRVTYYDQTNLQTMVAGTKYLVHNNASAAVLDAIDQTLPRISLGIDSATTVGPQGATEELFLMALSTSSNYPAGTNDFIVEKVGYVIGDHQNEYELASPPTTGPSTSDETPSTIDFRLDGTGTTILANDGKQYGVNSIHAVANGDGTIDIVALPAEQVIYDNLIYGNITITDSAAGTTENGAVNALNALFTNLPLGAGGSYVVTYPTTDAVDITYTQGEPTTPTTTKSDNTTVHLQTVSGTSGHDSRLWSTETIDQAGEYYLVKIVGNGRFIIGLGSENDGDDTEIVSDSGTAHSGLIWGQAFYDYGGYSAPWTIYGSSAGLSYGPGWTGSTTTMMRYNGTVQDELTQTDLRDGALFKIGIDQNGYIACWYYDAGRSNEFILTSRRNRTTPAGNYFLVVKLWDQTATIVETPQRSAVDPTAPALAYRYIESPDGSFYYPLFASADEAAYVDVQNGGAEPGSAHAHVFVDEPTNSVWYMPDNGGTHDGASAPANTAEITYTEIPTNADNLYGPALLNVSDYTFTENQTVNIQIHPQDTEPVNVTPEFTLALANLGLSYNNGFITGTTKYVPSTVAATITFSRSNSYSTTTESFGITVQDNASLGNLTGFTETAGNFVQPNRIVLDYDALLQYDTQISPGEELTYSYSQIPPTIGILSATGEANLAAFDPATDTLGTGDYNFAEQLKWALRYVSFGGYIGADSAKYNLRGWTDNSSQAGTEGSLANTEFKLEYGVDGYFRLYVGGILKLTSASTFSGAQTLTLAGFDDQAQSDVYVPSNWAIATTGAGTTTPPAGFVDPLLSGTMGSTTVLGDGTTADAATQVTEQLAVNHRFVFPRAWVEANILPYVGADGTDAYIGVPDPGTSWSDVGTGDFSAHFKIEGTSSTAHISKIKTELLSGDSFQINSLTNAFYDYALEWDGEDLHVIACNIGDINTQPGINNGGAFSRVMTYTGYGTAKGLSGQPLDIVIGVDNGGQVNLTTSGLQQIRIPFGARDVIVGETSNGSAKYTTLQPAASKFDEVESGHASYDGVYVGPTLNAGYTYRFHYHPSMESGDAVKIVRADDGTDYTTGVTFFGDINADPQTTNQYKGLQFAVPTDAPPLKIAYLNTYQGNTTYTSGVELPVSGSTYTVPVTGITREGPVANQTGTNVMDANDHGWISLDEQLSAGERLVLDNAFFTDFLAEVNGTNTIFAIGLKGDSWVNTFEVNNATAASTGEIFKGNTYLVGVCNSNATGIQFRIVTGSTQSNLMGANSTEFGTLCAFFDITSTGNNIRAGFGRNGNLGVSAGDESTVAYADWSAYKAQTGDQGYGITSKDVVMSFWTFDGGDIDGAEIDWTGLSEVSVPAPAPSPTTPWTKALDFSGSSERALQVTNLSSYCPIRMADLGQTAVAPTTVGYTTNDGYARPWATAVVFSSDNNSSNQHIWNQGEGAGSTDDNIYLRVDANRNLYFGWGRTGALNECSLGTLASGPGHWYGIYIAHTGERLSGSNATAANLADCFDIRGINLETGSVGSQISSASNWITTGGRMDRTIAGDFTVGGRGSNRNFHGKIASMVVTTLRRNQPMPTTSEIAEMVRDPQQWQIDYKNGQTFRPSHLAGDSGSFAGTSHYNHTQIWLMGDGANDAYAQIRNDVSPNTQGGASLNMISMVSNDIETVSITGLS